MRVFKTISLTVPDGYQHDVDYSAVSLEDIIIDALPLKDGKMIGVVLFRPDDSRVTEAKTGAQARELFEKYLPQFVPFINDVLGFMLPKVHSELAQCATMYDNVYSLVQTRFCPAIGS